MRKPRVNSCPVRGTSYPFVVVVIFFFCTVTHASCLNELYRIDRIGTGIALKSYFQKACYIEPRQNNTAVNQVSLEKAENWIQSKKAGVFYSVKESEASLRSAYAFLDTLGSPTCDDLTKNEGFLLALARQQTLRNTLATCESMTRLGLPCGPTSNPMQTIGKFEKMEANVRSLLKSKPNQEEVAETADWLRQLSELKRDIQQGTSSVMARFPNYPPRRNPNIRTVVSSDEGKVRLQLIVPVDMSAVPDRALREKLRSIVSRFWKAEDNFQGKDYEIEVVLEDTTTETAYELALETYSGPEGSVSHVHRRMMLRSGVLENIDSAKSNYLINHEIGHLLGYWEHYGYYVQTGDCGYGELSPPNDIMGTVQDYSTVSVMSPKSVHGLLTTYYFKTKGDPSMEELTETFYKLLKVADEIASITLK